MNELEPLISQFIDDELSLEEKRVFLVEVGSDSAFVHEAISLVDQEIRLCADPFFNTDKEPHKAPSSRRFKKPKTAVLALAASILLAAAGVLFVDDFINPDMPSPLVSHRFVLYRPDAPNVEISGSFNGWAPVAMQPAGNTGYWEAVLELPPGEYKFSYLVGADWRIPDPTLMARETDGFGGENSILKLEA